MKAASVREDGGELGRMGAGVQVDEGSALLHSD